MPCTVAESPFGEWKALQILFLTISLHFSAHIQEKTVYRFVLEMDLMHLLDFNGMINN